MREKAKNWWRSVFLRDQAWANMRSKQERILRIYQRGPRSEADMALVKQIIGMVLGEIAFRQKELRHLSSKDE
jgi:hypothetical protein